MSDREKREFEKLLKQTRSIEKKLVELERKSTDQMLKNQIRSILSKIGSLS